MKADELLRLRQRLHLTQAQMAEKLGLSRTAIQNYERGRRPIPLYVELAAHQIANKRSGRNR